LVELWQTNQKFFVLINCQGLGYEIQILESFFLKLKTNQISNKKITLWLKHIKKEDSDLLFGFTSKEQKNFFIEILSIRGVGSQIGMGILNKFSISEVINAIKTQNKKLICSVPGIGQKMSDRLILELKNKFKSELQFEEEKAKDEFEIKDPEINKMMQDLKLTLQSLNYKNKEINTIMPIIKESTLLAKKEKNLSFENLLKIAKNNLDKDSSNIGRWRSIINKLKINFMSLDTAEKQKLIETHQVHSTDTGSVEVQVAMLSKRISKLSDHLQGNIHDFASRQGLLKMIGKRKRLLSYIKDKNVQRYQELVKKIGIRGWSQLMKKKQSKKKTQN